MVSEATIIEKYCLRVMDRYLESLPDDETHRRALDVSDSFR